jgi:putative Mg2+ transporter-C (MgtC) family protein
MSVNGKELGANEYFANPAGQFEGVAIVAMAAVLGGLLGVERELANKPAGFRTLMLVAGASALLMILGETVYAAYAPATGASPALDPTRVIQAIVMGIGFICAGTIIRRSEGSRVEGLTTAAVILMAAAVGIAVALKQLLLAIGMTVLTLIVLIGFRAVEDFVAKRVSKNQRDDSP